MSCVTGGNIKWSDRFGKLAGFFFNLSIHLPCDLVIPTYSVYLKEMKTYVINVFITQNNNSSLINNSPKLEALICPSLGECIKKLCHIYTVEIIHLTNKIHRAAWRGGRLTRKHHKGTLWEHGNVLFSFGEGLHVHIKFSEFIELNIYDLCTLLFLIIPQ